uniref:Photosystem II 10 kDa polypeptide, chloroplastic n=1 Tax=Mesostigma viride TaxID=41882 RepID=A2SY31_MESVI|nr:photosystem II PsbR protein [Mesostigma viride]|eukprot:jgi/Mesvir1/7439/Mv19219-RA.1
MATSMVSASVMTSSFAGVKLAKVNAAPRQSVVKASPMTVASGGPKKLNKLKGPAELMGYKLSTQAGSAPPTKDGKPGKVYKLSGQNVDEYSPIYTPEQWASNGDTYAGGVLGLAIWAVLFLGVLGFSAFAILSTSSL